MPYQLLIVVDDPLLRQRYAEILETAASADGAYEVVSVSTVTSALWYAARRPFDLVMIEERIRGPLDALRRLLVEQNPRVRMITIGTQNAIPRAAQRPDITVLAPDCNATELRATVRLLLSLPAPLAIRS